MATFNGNLADLTREYDAVVWNPGYGSHNVVAPAKSLRETTDAAVGSYGDQNPVALPGDSFSGDEADQYGFLDWFNRMHVQYAVLDLGNLISAQVREVEVFSTYFTDRALTTVTPTNDDGLVLAAPGAYPLTWLPFASKTFELTAGTDGPANIDANYDFQFDIGTIPMSVIGTRVILWAFHPDWRQPVLERLEWLTTVVRSYNGKEQRMRVRQGPRASWEFTFNVHGWEANVLDSVMYDWQGRVWALPIWPDGTTLTSAVTAGDSVVNVDTGTRDFHVGGLVVITTPDGQSYEAFELVAVTSSSVTAKRPLTNSWPAGYPIFPVRVARMTGSLPLRRHNAAHVSGTAQFQCDESVDREAATETLYRSYPVLAEKPNWRDGLEYAFTRALDVLDNQSNPQLVVEDPAPSQPVQGFVWTFTDRAEQDAMRKFLYARAGRWKAVWVPTFTNDLRLADVVTSAQTNVDVEAVGLKQFLRAGVHRRDIRIELWDGTVLYRRCSGYTTVSAGVERMTLSSALGVTVQPGDVKMISWMMLARLDQDAVEVSWRNAHAGDVAFTLTGFNNDV